MKKIIKYSLTFIITLGILLLLHNLVLMIPNNSVEKNIKESVQYLQKTGDRPYLIENSNKYLNETTKLDNFTDAITLNLIWNNTNKTQIQMNYYYDGSSAINSLDKVIKKNLKTNLEYSRYYQGQIIYVKPLLLFFNLKEIRIINCIIITILIIYMIYILYKRSKLLTTSIIIGLLSINIFVVPLTIQFFVTFFITLILSILVIKTINKDDDLFFQLMIIGGLTTNFFDFLTTETITLTIPLLIRIYLKNKDSKKINLKKELLFIIKTCLAWGISYVLAFMIKWILAIGVYGIAETKKIWEYAKIRIYDIPTKNRFLFILSTLLNILSFLLPFSFFEISSSIVIIFLLFIVWLFVFELKKRKQKLYGLMAIVGIIPIIRFIILYAHTAVHLYFVYRAAFPLVITITIIFIESIILKRIKK